MPLIGKARLHRRILADQRFEIRIAIAHHKTSGAVSGLSASSVPFMRQLYLIIALIVAVRRAVRLT